MVMVADVPPMVRMTTGWVVLLLAVAVSGQHPPACRTFLAENIAPGESKGYRCPAEECPGGQVYGTAVYDKDSDICLSALHSGVVTSLAANITIKHLSTPQPVLGTAQNRIVSHSKKGSQPLSVYKVESTAQQEGMVGQVMLVYNFIKEGKGVRFICLSQDQESPISPSRHLKTWNYKDINNIGTRK
ncbi:uncharacterized protein LOC126983515 [Eriocheir sinensis]|uniref:uncharacterized protein LOC126983515 n=1 Tax=Eriocheir sinensis TaxID=95602 RepID=UPI0021C5F3AA|nr:uncharacterized protein LOC126983515 [Eriocheir sinensis]